MELGLLGAATGAGEEVIVTEPRNEPVGRFLVEGERLGALNHSGPPHQHGSTWPARVLSTTGRSGSMCLLRTSMVEAGRGLMPKRAPTAARAVAKRARREMLIPHYGTDSGIRKGSHAWGRGADAKLKAERTRWSGGSECHCYVS